MNLRVRVRVDSNFNMAKPGYEGVPEASVLLTKSRWLSISCKTTFASLEVHFVLSHTRDRHISCDILDPCGERWY